MATFFPEPYFTVEIPAKMIETLYNLKSSLKDSKTPKETQKLINEAKMECLMNATRENPETSKILDDTRKLFILMESVKVRRRCAERVALDAATKRAYEALVAEYKEKATK
uniref:Uncharacterized protein n=1 Tax=Panagrolaimus davidi TaxID=227884 RepID=A0A914PAX8_9BILA